MTTDEYKVIRQALDRRHRDDLAALDRLWVLLNGTRNPDGDGLDPADQDRLELAEARRIANTPELPSETNDEQAEPKKRKPWSIEARSRQAARAKARWAKVRKRN